MCKSLEQLLAIGHPEFRSTTLAVARFPPPGFLRPYFLVRGETKAVKYKKAWNEWGQRVAERLFAGSVPHMQNLQTSSFPPYVAIQMRTQMWEFYRRRVVKDKQLGYAWDTRLRRLLLDAIIEEAESGVKSKAVFVATDAMPSTVTSVTYWCDGTSESLTAPMPDAKSELTGSCNEPHASSSCSIDSETIQQDMYKDLQDHNFCARSRWERFVGDLIADMQIAGLTVQTLNATEGLDSKERASLDHVLCANAATFIDVKTSIQSFYQTWIRERRMLDQLPVRVVSVVSV
eukprot:TRINITY_DN46236_c0_g1_i1.p1 TRINITY_DN46236_c0_g1~~TRINITY_DN46236_c0_g1_i1.p1  ORF type:complete len:289 (-),score=39.78 TRINITY_DN46236_c0_g1_i1:339-1205(-)